MTFSIVARAMAAAAETRQAASLLEHCDL